MLTHVNAMCRAKSGPRTIENDDDIIKVGEGSGGLLNLFGAL